MHLSQGEEHSFIGDADDTTERFSRPCVVRNETIPDIGNDNLRLGQRNPLAERRNDIRVLVRGKDIRHFVARAVFSARHEQVGKGQFATRVDNGDLIIVDDDELIGLDTFSRDQIVKNYTLMGWAIKR